MLRGQVEDGHAGSGSVVTATFEGRDRSFFVFYLAAASLALASGLALTMAHFVFSVTPMWDQGGAIWPRALATGFGLLLGGLAVLSISEWVSARARRHVVGWLRDVLDAKQLGEPGF